jgi:hypothetical protein
MLGHVRTPGDRSFHVLASCFDGHVPLFGVIQPFGYMTAAFVISHSEPAGVWISDSANPETENLKWTSAMLTSTEHLARGGAWDLLGRRHTPARNPQNRNLRAGGVKLRNRARALSCCGSPVFIFVAIGATSPIALFHYTFRIAGYNIS